MLKTAIVKICCTGNLKHIACSMTHLKNSHNMKLDLVTEDAARTFSKKSWLFKVTFASI